MEPALCRLEIPAFPIMHNPNPKETELPDGVEVLSESEGNIDAYTIYGDNVYYLVGYRFHSGIVGYRYMSLFRQPLAGGEAEKLIDYESDRYMEVTRLYYDGQLKWIGCIDDYELWQYTIYNNHVEKAIYEEEIPPAMEDIIKYHDIDKATLDGRTWVCHQNETYIVWAKWPCIGDSATSVGSTTNILNKETGEVTVIQNSDYCEGSLSGQVLYGDYLFFYVYDDEQAHVQEEDFFDNNYMYDLKTGKVKRLTENHGGMKEYDSIWHDRPQIYEKGICFLGKRANAVDEGYITYLYYMEMRQTS